MSLRRFIHSVPASRAGQQAEQYHHHRDGMSRHFRSESAMTSRPWLVVAALLIPGVLLQAQTPDRAALVRKQEDQERARAMTRSLLDGVLQMQLRQLEDNGLTDLPVYRDIGLMRQHLQEIVDEEMPKVVELLATAQSAAPDRRDASFAVARQTIRTVVVRLSAERQSLLRRLKAAELIEQVQRLSTLQTDVQKSTRRLREEAQLRQAAAILKTQEDQRDVKGFFLHLVDTLDDVRTWGGPISETAVDGLRILKAGDVGQHVDLAEAELVAAKLPDAVEHQTAVLKGLADLLKLLQKSQGAMNTERNAAVAKLRAIAHKQAEVREDARQLPDDAPAPPELVEEQVKLQQALAELHEQLPELPAGERLAQQAEAAAKSAAEELFNAKTDGAIERQTEVLGSLAALEDLLTEGGRESQADKSAAELAAEVADLKAAQKKLQAVAALQEAVAKIAETDAAAAAKEELNVSQEVAAVKEGAELPDTVEAALAEAREEAASAAEALSDAMGAVQADDAVKLERADDALDRALATVAAELEDTERRAAAVKIGELARAADVLERAAAEERAVAAELSAAMTDDAATAEDLGELAERQADVAAIADKVAEGLEETSSKTSEQVKSAQKHAENGQEQVQKAILADAAAKSEPLKNAEQSANSAAESLAQAAEQIREEIAAAAKDLADRSGARAAQLAQARENVEQATSPASLAERMGQLEQAKQQTQQAAAQQQRASGRPEAAAAMDLAREIADLQAAQVQADQAAKSFERGSAATPLKATTAQQAVAEQAAALSDKSKDASRAAAADSPAGAETRAAAAALDQAQAAAAEAARALLQGKPAQASAARQKTSAALVDAAKHAAAAVEQAQAAKSTASPDAEAQQLAAEGAARAAEMAQADAPEAATPLAQAAEAGEAAASDLQSGKVDAAKATQTQAESALAAAEKEIDKAIRGLAAEQAETLAAQAKQAGELTQPTAMLDPAAAEALAAAEDAAMTGAEPTATPAVQEQAAISAQQQLERAAASLAAREQEVRRDQAVAAALAELATKQQAAARTLAEQRAAMAADSPTGTAPTNTEQAAAAAEDFAEAQMATGQGAVELSGQQEVANTPLRDALRMAGELLSARQAAALAEAADAAMAAAATPLVPAEGGAAPPLDAATLPADGDAAPAAGQSSTAGTPPPGSTAGSPARNDTGFVPHAPQLTAQMMAGQQLAEAMQQAAQNAQAAAAHAATPPQDATTNPSAQQLATNTLAQPQNTPTSAQSSSLQTSRQSAGQKENEAIKDGPLQDQPEGTDLGDKVGGKRDGDADLTPRQFQDQPWFAKLPPELRKSIRSGTQQKAPRAYEERLRKYFQSVD